MVLFVLFFFSRPRKITDETVLLNIINRRKLIMGKWWETFLSSVIYNFYKPLVPNHFHFLASSKQKIAHSLGESELCSNRNIPLFQNLGSERGTVGRARAVRADE